MNPMNQFYVRLKTAVCRHMQVDEHSLFHSNKERCVDARYVLVSVLSEFFTDDEVADFCGMSRTGVNKIRNRFRIRMRKLSFRCHYTEARREADSIAADTFTSAVNEKPMP